MTSCEGMMLNETFVHIRLIGEKRERYLWHEGVRTWDDVANRIDDLNLPEKVKATLTNGVARSKKALAEKDYAYFLDRLRSEHLIRLYPYLMEGALYLDIETNGFIPIKENVTVIGCYDGKKPTFFVQGRNLDAFPAYLSHYRLLVTFNGKAFDVPFLEKAFGRKITVPHIDLRNELARVGFRGGLKKIEIATGLTRPSSLAQLDGYAAVLLWNEYLKTRDEDVLNTLISYNLEDTVNLAYLMRLAYNKRVAALGKPHWQLPPLEQSTATHPFSEHIIARILAQQNRSSRKRFESVS